ncbi:DUF1800 family protein [Emticicia sp. BO119]|uniref:DUF1800 domain-containing protein n=1 Tax=Emticicia sp. BO119 TaxID=2757768 RepID=UPI0015EFE86D|nr:DUF1800 domain-containing protein [Emticicia sp. BO119]MBA4852365.1 DUF1800 domain-containing protein [Emticicia sp. BO119]
MSFPLFAVQRLFGIRQVLTIVLLSGFLGITLFANAQEIVTFGKGNAPNVKVSASGIANQTGIRTLMSSGYLPNKNSAARLLSQATLGTTYDEIENVATLGVEKWVDQQLATPNSFNITTYLQNLHQSIVDSLKRTEPSKELTNVFLSDWHFDISWFQGSMTATDILRWRVALGLSEIFVTSRISAFDGNPYALASYYDVLLENSFTNYRTLIEKITYHPSMAVYLTFMNNHATDFNNGKQTFPDENYARELMQLFSIGLFQLNLDGTEKKDGNGKSIPTYNNNDIANLAKVFTGLSWGDSRYIGERSKDYWSYTKKLKFYAIDSSDVYIRWWVTNPNNWRIVNAHEVGAKTFLGSTIPARSVSQGELDIKDALDIIFNHPNVGPFISRRLVQRLVTSNPSPAYIQRVATIFNNNGSGVRGDLKAVIKAILTDPEARDCCNNGNTQFAGGLKEPFLRYMNLVKGLNLKSSTNVYRNSMRRAYEKTGQIPMYSPSVFNFFSPDYKPDGALKGMGKYGPEFQTLNSQTLTGYMNALNSWLINDDPIEYYGYFGNETYKPEQEPRFNFTADYPLTRNDRLTQLLDKYNLILTHGRVSEKNLAIIKKALLNIPLSLSNGVPDNDDALRRVRIAVYLIMSSPDYLINK